MKSKNGNILYGARVTEKIELEKIEFTDPETKETTSVGVRFVDEVEEGEFSELDILSLNKAETIVFTWAQKKPKPLKTKA